VEYLGRLDHQVKVRGYRIELGEVAAALEEHPAVRQAVVTLRSKDGDRRLVAHVVPAGAPPAGDELREHLERKLPSYMVPAAYGVLEELPLTPHGKVDTAALPEPESGRPAGRRRVAYQPPRDPWEVELASIWEEIFQTHPIGVADNFFALGGHSFLGVQMMGKIFEAFKVDLPLSALFKGPTIAQLAVELRAGAPPRRSPLVTLARGDGPAPFFCVHSAGGNVLSYFELARRLSPPRSFYALQDPRLVGDDFEPEVTVEEVAASYLEAVRGVQERGPYHLGGWSFGGVVAYEMARQLDAAGERVATLALLDAATTDEQELARKDDAEVLAELFRDLGVTAEGLRGPTADVPLERLLAVLEERGLLREQAVELARARRLLEVFKSHQRAFRGYRFRPYGGPATLFRASVAPETGDPVAEGWRRLVPGLEVVRVPGDHNTMVREPHAQTLAERLSAVLERAAGEGGEGDV
jgi:thioesterase domain-containing protein